MEESFALLSIVGTKRLISSESRSVHIEAVKMMLSDAMRTEDSLIGPIPPEQATPFITRCVRLHDAILEAYRLAPTRASIQDQLTAALQDDVQLVAGQGALALLCRGNAEFILHRAYPAPQMWLNLLDAAEGDAWVG